MFVAGFSASYLTERAEGKHLIEEIENKQQSSITHEGHKKTLSHSIIEEAEKESALLVSLIAGLTPAVTILVTILPMLFGIFSLMTYSEASLVSLGLGFFILFLLGVFLAKVAKDNIWLYGLKTIIAGVVTLVILLIVSALTGATHG
jgi:predicted membrane protein (TIGR00267 family)